MKNHQATKQTNKQTNQNERSVGYCSWYKIIDTSTQHTMGLLLFQQGKCNILLVGKMFSILT
jgi:hypothetical protein